MKKAFSNELYVELQSKHIQERIEQFDNKLYLEFGGKLFDDTHASRVLPGFEPDSKLKMLLTLKDKVEVYKLLMDIIVCGFTILGYRHICKWVTQNINKST